MEIVHISLVGIIALINLIFGIRVYYSNKKNLANKYFSLFAFLMTIWILLDFSLYQKSLEQFQTLLNRLDLSVIEIFLFVWVAFIIKFPKEITTPKKYLKYFSSIALFIVVILTLFSKYIVEYAFMENYGSNFVQSKLFYVFPIFSTILAIYSVFLIIKKYRYFREQEKTQIKYIITGISLFFLFNIVFNLAIPMITKSFVTGRFGSCSAVFFVGFTAYAILKAHAFNLKIILTETAVVIIDVVLAVQVFTSKSLIDGLLRALFCLVVFYGSYILLRSVREEIRQREEVQELTRKLTEVNLRLKELDKMKSEFLSVASHELNSPMSVIKGYLHMILYEGFGKVNKEAKTYLNHVYTKTDQLAKLVSDLLNVSRIEQGRVKLQIQPTDPMQIAKSAVENYNVKAREKGIEINLHQPDGVIPKVSADPGKLEEILSNLLSNSVKYTKEGHINLLFEKTDGEVKFTVKDTGIGIPKEAQKNIFKKFYRVDNTWVREAGGTGLGLYIIKGYVELMNGKIWFESEGENKGTTFYFTIPLAKASDAGKIEEKNLEFEEKNRPEYTESKFKPSEIKKEMKEVTENNKKEENKEGKPQSLKDQLLSHKEERARMKEKILKQAEEFRKKQKQ